MIMFRPLGIFMAILVVIWLIMLSSLSLTSEAVPEYRWHVCSNTTTFRPNSTYQSYLNNLLSSLTSNASRADINNGYYNTTAGRDRGTVVYGCFLCRGDVTVDMCQECVATANQKLVQEYCPTEKVAVIWYDHCMIRYSNESFFGKLDESLPNGLMNTQDITDPVRFNQLVTVTMNDTLTRAVSGAKKFATKEARFTASQTLYSLVQCTPDLSSSDCETCLGGFIARIPSWFYGKRGGNVLGGSCNIRYEVYPFYELTVAPTPTPVLLPPSLPPPPPQPQGKSQTSTKVIVISIAAPIAVVLSLFVGYYFLRRRARDKCNEVKEGNDGNEITTVESLQFDLSTIKAATNNFSDGNKLGKGGFGEVYKGTLPNGQDIAAKRLSKSSGQGTDEFKTEVELLAKLQHRNLVRLLGFCLEGEEKILIYEFVPNKSLDHFLFDIGQQAQLGWTRRYKIISGVARGILYLHEDSRLRIIHRDLKSSNILLDKDMNPKISDFGMAKIFGVDQTQGNTSRIVGTYGYMSPEYAFYGQFSVKSDVYSFGVLILEIITGKKNSSFFHSDGAEDLLSYAWKHWTNGTTMELLDPSLGVSYSRNEVIRCIHIGLLCAQEDPADRPTMATIVLMLNSYSVTLALPKKPAFFPHTRNDREMPSVVLESDTSKTSSKSKSSTINDMSISEFYPR